MSGNGKPQESNTSLGTLAGAASFLLGSGVTELQSNIMAGLILVGLGVVCVVTLQIPRVRTGQPPTR